MKVSGDPNSNKLGTLLYQSHPSNPPQTQPPEVSFSWSPELHCLPLVILFIPGVTWWTPRTPYISVETCGDIGALGHCSMNSSPSCPAWGIAESGTLIFIVLPTITLKHFKKPCCHEDHPANTNQNQMPKGRIRNKINNMPGNMALPVLSYPITANRGYPNEKWSTRWWS